MPIEYDWHGHIKSASATNSAEAKVVIAELRFKRREWVAHKKGVNMELTQFRASLRSKLLAVRPPWWAGSSTKLGRQMVREEKAKLKVYADGVVQQLQERKYKIELCIATVDTMILDLQEHMVKEEAKTHK